MRVRIKKHPFEEGFWGVQVKHWWSGWIHKNYFFGDNAQERALAAAKELINPTVTEVFKVSHQGLGRLYVTDNPTDIKDGQQALPLYTGATK